jgi:co-chaperonin GroES (HSP10)
MKPGQITPLGERVLVREDDVHEQPWARAQTDTIIIPDTVYKGACRSGIVVALGTGWKSPDGENIVRFEVQVGDRVYYPKASVTEIKVDGDAGIYHLVDVEWLHAILET